METTKLSSKGQVIIPKAFRVTHHWDPGLELMVIERGDGILLKPRAPFEATTLDDVAGCLSYQGPTKTQEDMDAAMKRAAKEAWHDSD
ncbi:MAG: AbrB/MazE/SpoVT family DNA-binding domain-containing protein [Pseudomonadota bacterium]